MTISAVVSAVELRAETTAVAGLVNKTTDAAISLTSVLNLARLASSSSSGIDESAALVYGDSVLTALTADKTYRWQGLSASAATYHPFTSDTVDDTPWKYNGDAVSCGEFSKSSFWTDSGSMSFSTNSGWDFSRIGDGYLPTLNGMANNTPFSCMNTYTTDEVDSGTIVPWAGSGSVSTLPVYDRTDSRVQYWTPATGWAVVVRALPKDEVSYYSVWLNGSTVAKAELGANTFTLSGAATMSENRVELRFKRSFCESELPNIANRSGQADDPYRITRFEELICLQDLVNYDVGEYRTGNYWLFSSFSAGGATISPIGTAAAPFSGTITADSWGAARVEDLTVAGGVGSGLFGVSEGELSVTGLDLRNVTVSGASSVGALIGSAGGSVRLRNVAVSGQVTASSNTVGGVIGRAEAEVSLSGVTFNGSVAGSGTAGGLVGAVQTGVSVNNAQVDGTIGSANSPVAGGLIGSVIGTSAVTLEQAIVTGTILGSGTLGGAIGQAIAAVSLTDVSVTGELRSAKSNLGGLIGVSENSADFSNVLFEGTVAGSATLGGLIGSASASVSASAVSVNALLGTPTSSLVGGLIGLSTGGPSGTSVVEINQTKVGGMISGSSALGGAFGSAANPVSVISTQVNVIIGSVSTTLVGGLVGIYTGSSVLTLDQAILSGTINGTATQGGVVGSLGTSSLDTPILRASHLILTTRLMGASQIAGLANVFGGSISMSNVVNTTWHTGNSSDPAQISALATSGSSLSLAYSQSAAFRYSDMTTNVTSYIPFTDGLVSDTYSRFNGSAVPCSVFSQSAFWTGSDSMALSSTDGWDFSRISDGYLPSLNGESTHQPFICMNRFVTENPDLGTVAPWSGSVTLTTRPIPSGPRTRVQYNPPSVSTT
jgi:hypothetical protein